MRLSFLYGVRAGDWWRLLRANRFAVDPSGWPYAALITLFSLLNSWLARRDGALDLSGVRVHPPVFLLGHWRSGTTHLHYLLSQDPELAAPNTYQCAYPHSFLTSQDRHGRLLEPIAPTRRPQDDVDFSLWTPQEDELGLAALCPYTPYLAWAFPRNEEHYMRFLTFRDAAPEARAAFEHALLWFVRKLSAHYERPLVLKSPGHTARIPILRRLFPDARFVLITRDPYVVFQSSVHLYRTWLRAFAFLQRPDPAGIEERVLSLYEQMYRAFFDDESLLPRERYHAVRFEDLEADPVGELRRLYTGIGLEPFPEDRISAYLGRIEGYRKNRYPPLEPSLRAQIRERWAPSFEAWGYPT